VATTLFQLIIGITDKWDTDDNISSSGARLCIRIYSVGRNFAFARAATLLNEEDFDEMPHVLVVYGHKSRSWGHCQDTSRQNGTDQAGT